MPRTRSNNHSSLQEDINIEDHLEASLTGVQFLRSKVRSLESENEELREQVKTLSSSSSRPSKARDRAAAEAAVGKATRQLKRKIEQLTEEKERYRKRIRKLEINEAKREAQDLGDGSHAHDVVGENYAQMKALLRSFRETVEQPSLEEKEECAICLSQMKITAACSLICQHVFHKECIEGIPSDPDDPETFPCPHCRTKCIKGDFEDVTLTANDQWDKLVDIATKWAHIDASPLTDDDEEDDQNNASEAADEIRSDAVAAQDSPPDSSLSPPPNKNFASMSSPEKRQVLENLSRTRQATRRS